MIRTLTRGITHPDEPLSKTQRVIAGMWRSGVFAGTRLRYHRAPQLAAALAYRTVFSLVPLLVLGLLALKTIYGESGVRDTLDKVMSFLGIDALVLESVPASEDAAAGAASEGQAEGTETLGAANQIEGFVEQAVERITTIDTTAIALVGVLVLVYSAISLLIQIESAFNIVSDARRGRGIVTRLTTYWTLITLGALAIVATLRVGEVTSGLLTELPGWLRWAASPAQVLLGVGTTWLLLLFAYTQMPTRRMKLKHAAIGAIVAAFAWEVLKGSLAGVLSWVLGGQVAIYGSLALVPILLLWIYVTWLVVLYGLELSVLIQRASAFKRDAGRGVSGGVAIDVGVVICIARVVAEGFERGRTTRLDRLADRAGVDLTTAEAILRELARRDIVHVVDESDEGSRYTLGRPPEKVGLDELADATTRLAPSAGDGASNNVSAAARACVRRALAGWTLAGDVADLATPPAARNRVEKRKKSRSRQGDEPVGARRRVDDEDASAGSMES